MKLVVGNGRILEVRDVGPVVYRLRAGDVPIKFHGFRLMEDDDARDAVRAARDTGLYREERP